jgi:uncharacterized protein (TIGR03067 family)
MPRILLLPVALLVLPLLGSDAPRGYDGAAEMDDLEGVWRRTAVTFNGRESDLGLEQEVTFGRGSFVYRLGGHEMRGAYTADRGRTPAQLDESFEAGPNAGRVWTNLFRVEGDTLRIAYNKAGTRPRDFGDSDLFVETYRRVRR